jgi:hypothetical protein
MSPEDLKKWYVRNSAGTMVPFSAFAKGEWIYGRRNWRATTAWKRWRSSVPGAGLLHR